MASSVHPGVQGILDVAINSGRNCGSGELPLTAALSLKQVKGFKLLSSIPKRALAYKDSTSLPVFAATLLYL